jgi:hypothetical protein
VIGRCLHRLVHGIDAAVLDIAVGNECDDYTATGGIHPR